jgi:hypothetical protein
MSPSSRQLNLTLPTELVEAAERAAADCGTTITAVVRRSLERLTGIKTVVRMRGRPKKKLEKIQNT